MVYDLIIQFKTRNNKRIVLVHWKIRKKKEVHNIKVVVTGCTCDSTTSKSMLQHPEEHHTSKSKKKSHP